MVCFLYFIGHSVTVLQYLKNDNFYKKITLSDISEKERINLVMDSARVGIVGALRKFVTAKFGKGWNIKRRLKTVQKCRDGHFE